MDLHDPRILEVCYCVWKFDNQEWFIEIHSSVMKIYDSTFDFYNWFMRHYTWEHPKVV